MKKIVILLTFIMSAVALSGQNNVGVDYYYLGEYKKAIHSLNEQLATNPAEVNYYFGEIEFALGNFSKAEEYYKLSKEADPMYVFANVGLAKLTLKTDVKAAEKTFKELVKKNKKNVSLAVAIGRAYLDNGMVDKAIKKAKDAKKIDKKSAEAFLFEGDIYASGETPDLGAASGQYEQARYFDPNYLLSYMKLAQVYEKRNPPLAVEILEQAEELNPSYVIVYAMMGRIYTSNGRYPEAIVALNKYAENSSLSIDDIERISRSYYFGDAGRIGFTNEEKYELANKYVNEGLSIEPDHFVLNRYKMYVSSKTGNYEEGLPVADKFFSLRSDAASYFATDYTAYGNIFKSAGQYKEAAQQFNKAIELEPDKYDIYMEAVDMAREIKDYYLAATFYQKWLFKKLLTDEYQYLVDRPSDVVYIGNLYYQGGTLTNVRRTPELIEKLMQDEERVNLIMNSGVDAQLDSLQTSAEYFTKYHSKMSLNKAKENFNELIESSADSYMGYYYMARTYNALQPGAEGIETGLPKEYYNKTVEILVSEDFDKSDDRNRVKLQALKEGLGYLSFYYYLKDDTANAVLFSNRVLELDPENKNANAILADIKSRQ